MHEMTQFPECVAELVKVAPVRMASPFQPRLVHIPDGRGQVGLQSEQNDPFHVCEDSEKLGYRWHIPRVLFMRFLHCCCKITKLARDHEPLHNVVDFLRVHPLQFYSVLHIQSQSHEAWRM